MSKLFRLSFILMFLMLFTTQAQEPNQLNFSAVDPNQKLEVPVHVEYALDFMLSNWLISKQATIPCDPDKLVPPVNDSIVRRRLELMPCVIEMPFNQNVRTFIEMYTQRRRRQISYLLGLGDFYFRTFEEALDKYNLPQELKFLPVIESALNPTAVSRMGAAGLWQFMLATGRMYGLEVNNLVDERMDPRKSSFAAARYLRDLYQIYGDWHLVLAAYNFGPGNINKAIRRAGGKQDYWAIFPFLPAETRGYVPVFIAATYALTHASEYEICKAQIPFPSVVDTVMIEQRIHFEQIAAVLNMPVEEIRLLNPQYRRSIIPGDIKPYPVVIPVHLTGQFIDRLDEIAAYNADSLVNNRRAEIIPAGSASRTGNRGSDNVIVHTVRRGQTLSGIAAKYGVSVSRIKQWNNLRSTNIRAGSRLRIHK